MKKRFSKFAKFSGTLLIAFSLTKPLVVSNDVKSPPVTMMDIKNDDYCKREINIVFSEDGLSIYNKTEDNSKELKLIEIYEEINYGVEYREDNDLEIGKEKVISKGSYGEYKVVYEETYIDGELKASKEVNRTIVKSPSNKIVHIGVNPFLNSEENSDSGTLPKRYKYKYLDRYEDEFFAIINNHRVSNGVHALERRKDLDFSARYKSLSMIQLDYFGHENPQFEDTSFSYLMLEFIELEDYLALGENLAYKSSNEINIESLGEIFSALKNSEGHNENMLSSEHKYVGIGIAFAESTGMKYDNKPTITITNHFAK